MFLRPLSLVTPFLWCLWMGISSAVLPHLSQGEGGYILSAWSLPRRLSSHGPAHRGCFGPL